MRHVHPVLDLVSPTPHEGASGTTVYSREGNPTDLRCSTRSLGQSQREPVLSPACTASLSGRLRVRLLAKFEGSSLRAGRSASSSPSGRTVSSLLLSKALGIWIVGIEARDFGFEIPAAAGSQEVPNFSTQSMDNRRTTTGTATKSINIPEDKNNK